MALLKEETQQIVKQFQRKELDTGSPEVQVALLTQRITKLTDHFKAFKKDYHSQRGLINLVERRRKLLNYIRAKKPETYTKLIQDLGLRK
ncbi:MAG: 30S ribosomal protein S15 [Bdellovibrionaceae bacterium]|nr:30S ribosomal protein S15 [Pseudobdellovibrionaceae bacterium]